MAATRSTCSMGSSGYIGSERMRSREALGDGERAPADSQVGAGRLEVARQRVVDVRADPGRVQRRLQLVAAVRLDHVQVVDRLGPRLRSRGRPRP